MTPCREKSVARFGPKRRITLCKLFVWEANHVRVTDFWMDEPDVTNAQVRAFVEATPWRSVGWFGSRGDPQGHSLNRSTSRHLSK
jgi:hypothetical protein